MKNLRIRKIITALIVITWVPSSFASPSGIFARSSSAASRRSSIATSPSVETPSGIFARSSSAASSLSIEDSISIVDIDGKNQINFNFITGSNGQELVMFEYCQDGSCKPLGLKEGYSLEMLSSDKQFRELLAALEENDLQTTFEEIDKSSLTQAGMLAGVGALIMGIAKEPNARELALFRRAYSLSTGEVFIVLGRWARFVRLISPVLVFMGYFGLVMLVTAVVLGGFISLARNSSDADIEEAKEGTTSSTLVTEIEDAKEGTNVNVKEFVTAIEEVLKKFGSETLVPLPRD